MGDIIIASIISVIGAVISLIILHFSWISKLKWTAKIEEIAKEKEIKVARIKQPRPKFKRMPKNWIDQLSTAMELLGNEKVQKLIGLFSESEEEFGDNKVIQTLIDLGQNFLSGYQEGKQLHEQEPTESAY